MGADEQYTRNVETSQAFVERAPAVIADLLNHSNYNWAAQNCKQAADAYIDLGLLRWRRGIDPREDFDSAIRACAALNDLVVKHKLPKSDFDLSPAYAAMYLMGYQPQIEYFDENAFKKDRWLCYQCRLVHALHDQAPSANLEMLADRHLAGNEELPDRIFETYFQLLGLRPARLDREEQVRRAKATWAERRRGDLLTAPRPMDGLGEMNDLYVDIYLAAVLRKIGSRDYTVHAWRWD